MRTAKLSANIIDTHIANIVNNDLPRNPFSAFVKLLPVTLDFKKVEKNDIVNYRLISIKLFTKKPNKFYYS